MSSMSLLRISSSLTRVINSTSVLSIGWSAPTIARRSSGVPSLHGLSSTLASRPWPTSALITSNVPLDPFQRQSLFHRPNQQSYRFYTPMTKEEEDKEKQRVSTLTPFAKDQELRQYNREIARLEKLRGINTGELYTWTGRYKTLARDYGTSLVIYYGVAWAGSAVLCFGAMQLFNVDALLLLAQVDAKLGWDLCSKVSPEMGQVGVALILNEFLEVVRLPLVVLTVKPVIDRLYPPKM
jgi:hypothetical protein